MPEQALFCSSRLLSQHARGRVPREPVLPPSVMVVAARERGLVATRLHYLRMSGRPPGSRQHWKARELDRKWPVSRGVDVFPG